MVRDLTNEENQATSEPPLDDVVDGDAMPSFIQFRGSSTSVTVDDFNLIFQTEERNNRIVHKPLPVVTEEQARSGDAPANAVVLPVAVELVRTNNLFGFGVACERETEDGGTCGKVFATMKSLKGHLKVHNGGGGDADTDAETDNEGDN